MQFRLRLMHANRVWGLLVRALPRARAPSTEMVLWHKLICCRVVLTARALPRVCIPRSVTWLTVRSIDCSVQLCCNAAARHWSPASPTLFLLRLRCSRELLERRPLARDRNPRSPTSLQSRIICSKLLGKSSAKSSQSSSVTRRALRSRETVGSIHERRLAITRSKCVRFGGRNRTGPRCSSFRATNWRRSAHSSLMHIRSQNSSHVQTSVQTSRGRTSEACACQSSKHIDMASPDSDAPSVLDWSGSGRNSG
mmetsp:Transcript_76329/g.134757  ORF Transcript_76329/g.134757 Transcript_76329/m.134757 type:complete len:253 (+) Transcript_76329:1884-2642(+)